LISLNWLMKTREPQERIIDKQKSNMGKNKLDMASIENDEINDLEMVKENGVTRTHVWR
jgi:hypothetical protein